MNKTFVIAQRDYLASVKTKSFLVSLVLMPVLMLGGLVVGKLSQNLVDTAPKKVAVIDRTVTAGEKSDERPLYQVLNEAAQKRDAAIRNPDTDKLEKAPYEIEPVVAPADVTPEQLDKIRYDLSERVRDGDLFAFVEIGPDVVSARPVPAGGVQMLAQVNKLADQLGIDKGELQDAFAGMNGGAEQRAQATIKLQSLFDPDKIDAEKLKNSDLVKSLSQMQDNTGIRYTAQNTTYLDLQQWLRQTLKPVIDDRRIRTLGNVDPLRVLPLLQEPQIVPRALAVKEAGGGIGYDVDPNPIISFVIPIFMLFLMFTVIMTASQPLTTNVIEEKQLRIAEVLLGSVRPFELMLGKLIGTVGVSLTLAAIYSAGGLFLAGQFNVLDAVSPATIAWFLLFAGIGTLMYGALFVAVGAAVTNLKEAQNLLTPVILLVVAPMFAFMPIVTDPNGTLARAMTYFPLTTPMGAVLRLAVPPGMATAELVAAAALSLVTTVALIWLAGRIFRFGMLHTDKAAAMRDMLRWVVRG